MSEPRDTDQHKLPQRAKAPPDTAPVAPPDTSPAEPATLAPPDTSPAETPAEGPAPATLAPPDTAPPAPPAPPPPPDAPAPPPPPDAPASPAPASTTARTRRRPLAGIREILVVDALAVILVVASGPAAFIWLDQSRGSLSGATATPAAGGSPTVRPSASPSAAAAGSGGASAAATLVFGDGTWSRTGSLPQAVFGSAAAVLSDGRVLVVGGMNGSSSASAVAGATTYDPATGRWTAVTHMLQPRAYPMAVTLADGSVLVAGGMRNRQPLDTAERYDPKTDTWVAAGRLMMPRTQGTLTLLPGGRVLAAGGGIEGPPGWIATATAELFDPATGAWSATAPMSVARALHTATLLAGGDVLIAGGGTVYEGQTGSVSATAEIYSPKTGAWRRVGAMSKPRYAQGAALLKDGRVMVAGGWYSTRNSDRAHNTVEVFDPATGAWTAAAAMTGSRSLFGLVGLPDGRILAIGGVDPSYKVEASAELYDSTSGTWRPTGSLVTAITLPVTVVLADGRVLVAGGGLDSAANKQTAISQIYTPAASPK